MLQINGSVQLVPGTVHTEPGTLRADDKVQPAVVQTLITMSGPVQVIYPAEAIDSIIEGLRKAREESVKNNPPTVGDLYVPSSMSEAENMAKAQEALKGEANEISGSKK